MGKEKLLKLSNLSVPASIIGSIFLFGVYATWQFNNYMQVYKDEIAAIKALHKEEVMELKKQADDRFTRTQMQLAWTRLQLFMSEMKASNSTLIVPMFPVLPENK